TGKQIKLLQASNGVWKALFSPDGSTILTSPYNNIAQLFDPISGEQFAPLKGHAQMITGAEFGPDGRRFVTASNEGLVIVWDWEPGRQVRTFRGHAGGVQTAEFSRDGMSILTTSRDRTVQVWDSETARLRLKIDTGRQYPFAAFSPDGLEVVTNTHG